MAGALLLAGCGGGAGSPGQPAPGTGAGSPGQPPAAACAPPAATSSLTASVRDPAYGARGDGVTDDTAAIQAAVDAVAGTGGTLTVPEGTYRVNAVTSIQIGGAMTLQFSAGAVLQAIPNSAGTYSVITVQGASGVNILGGTLQGDYGNPVTHTGTTGEWGMGLSISGSSQVAVVGVTVQDCWGDGFYLENGSSGITVCSVQAAHNRRNGMSIVSADTVVVRDSLFTGSGGTLPGDGIDIEPNPTETVNQVTITGCTLSGNAGDGIADGVPVAYTGAASITAVTISGNAISGNGTSTPGSSGIDVSNVSGHLVTGNTITGNTGDGILLEQYATGTTVTGNTVTGNTGNGILDAVGGNLISGNSDSGNGATP